MNTAGHEPRGALLSFRPDPESLARTLGLVIAGLVALHLGSSYVLHRVDPEIPGWNTMAGLHPCVDLNGESSLPTWYSASALLLGAIVAGRVAGDLRAAGDRLALGWWGVALAALAMSIDEVAMLHDRIPPLVLEWRLVAALGPPDSGLFRYRWVVLGLPVGLVGAALGVAFARRLPGPTRRLLLVAGVAFLGGALGMEMLGAVQATGEGEQNMTHACLIAVEEGLEMTGVLVFLYASLDYLRALKRRAGEGFEAAANATRGAMGEA